jgi:hypothetical protein
VIDWSAPCAPFAVPDGPLDIYQSIQRLEPAAWVAAHTHEGPESGVVLRASLARFEAGAIAAFAAGATFCTPGGAVHATGNPGSEIAEAVTLHVVRAGSPFSTPCACPGAPAPHPGSSNPARTILTGLRLPGGRWRARHAVVSLARAASVPIEAGTLLLVAAIAPGDPAAPVILSRVEPAP